MSDGKKEILLGDCLELMKDVPNGSIDMILADLPYGTTACKWDTIIPFDKLWEQYERIIKPNGAIVLTASQPFTTALINSNSKIFRYTLVWDKNFVTSPYLANKRPMACHEDIILFYKNQPTYNPQKIKRTIDEFKRLAKTGRKTISINEVYGNFNSKQTNREDNEYKHPKSIISIPTYHKTKSIHPTQKPTDLFEWLIKSYTNENDLVLDNTAGSGTTAIACLNTNRQFIVMEKEQKYYDIILKRVGDFNKNFEPQTLFGNEM